MRSYVASECKKYPENMKYFNWLRNEYKQFKTKSK